MKIERKTMFVLTQDGIKNYTFSSNDKEWLEETKNQFKIDGEIIEITQEEYSRETEIINRLEEYDYFDDDYTFETDINYYAFLTNQLI